MRECEQQDDTWRTARECVAICHCARHAVMGRPPEDLMRIRVVPDERAALSPSKLDRLGVGIVGGIGTWRSRGQHARRAADAEDGRPQRWHREPEMQREPTVGGSAMCEKSSAWHQRAEGRAAYRDSTRSDGGDGGTRMGKLRFVRSARRFGIACAAQI